MNTKMFVCLLFALIHFSVSECENGCSGHGSCTVFDMCICYRNWIGNDCSGRVCEFGLSFVDTPKGDLDSSDNIEGTDELVVVNSPLYPYGTTEKFPLMQDSDLNQLKNSAHYYAECSNAGICDRDTGICDCFEGFTGAGCQRMLCPGFPKECSGHGICQNLDQMASKDFNSNYQIWNKGISRGCICDKGYHGGDCSMRYCKTAVDPLYLDDVATVQYPMYFFAILTDASYSDISNGHGGKGLFRIKIHDTYGQSWYSNALHNGASCDEVISAMEGIPQAVVPAGMTKCFKVVVDRRNPLADPSFYTVRYPNLHRSYFDGHKIYTSSSRPISENTGFSESYAANKTTDPLLSGDIYLLIFYGNPGDFPQPEVNTYVNDGTRPTIVSYPNGNLLTASWTNGQQGSSADYFSDHCRDMKVQLKVSNGQGYLMGMFVPAELLRCLAGADYDDDNDRLDIRGDYGTIDHPHLVKLVRSVADYRDGGYYAALYYDPEATTFDQQSGDGGPEGFTLPFKGAFKVLHPIESLDDSDLVFYDVYSTKGTLQLVGNRSEAVFEFASNKIYTTNVTRDFNGLLYDGVLSCEAAGIPANAAPKDKPCLDKNDLFFLLDPYTGSNNAPYQNMYRAKSIVAQRDHFLPDIGAVFPNATLSRRNITSHYHKYVITTDINTNWAQDAPGNTGTFHVYKFTPHVNSTYQAVAECGNRGICNTFEGICECFSGYSGDACGNQDILAF